MFWDLIDTGRAEVATIWPHEFTDCGAWFTYLVCDPADVPSNRDQIDRILSDVVQNGVTQEELNQTLNKASAGIIMQSERPSNRLFGLGSRWLTKRQYLSTDERLEKIKRVTIGDVANAAKNYFQNTSHIEVVASGD